MLYQLSYTPTREGEVARDKSRRKFADVDMLGYSDTR